MKLFFFQILVVYTEVTFHLVPAAGQVAQAIKVSHFDCSSITENSLYAINQVRPCHITPEELEVSKATIALYTKHFRKELNATKCRIQHQGEKWHCGHNDHSSIDHTIAGITSDLIITPEHCRAHPKGASINLQGHWIGAEWDTKTPVVKVSNRLKQESLQNERLDFSGYLYYPHAKNHSKSHDGKRKSVIRYGTDFNQRSGRAWLRNNFTRPICLFLGLPGQLCTFQSSNRRRQNG